MFKKISVFFFVLVQLIFVTPANAFDQFITSPFNPLPFNNSFQNWNETRMYQPSVIFDNGIYKIWYASFNGSGFKIIYSTSSDGISWIRQNLLDLYPGFDNHDPAILKTANSYTLFFAASTNGGSQNFKIYRIDSTDGINFDPNSRQLVLQPSGSLESNAVSSPFVIFENGAYFLFYECWGSQGFRVCMATSADGNQWQRCQNNPVISELSDGPSVLKKDYKYYLYFQSSLGIRQAESSNTLGCVMTWTNFQTVLPEPIVGPVILENQNQLSLYYSGFSQAGMRIHLATSGIQSSPTPTLTPSPTLTPLPTETPIPLKKKLIIIPGTFASWNKNAMLHNANVSQSQWKLLGFVKEYDGLTKTLETLDYVKNEDYFIFNYDWRKKIEIIADDLNLFITNNNLSNTKLDLVGHSLGGLIGRFYIQKYGNDDINKLITLGSPHQGTANTYKIVEAGELDKENTTQWLMQKLFLQSHRKNFISDKALINSLAPVSKDLFPIYDFLLDTENNLISIRDMEIKNLSLLASSLEFPDIFSLLTTVSGEKGNNTLLGFKIEPRNTLDILLNNYPDGRPTENRLALGDNLVTKNSTQAGINIHSLAGNHSEIVYKKESIDLILSELNIPHTQNQITEGKETKISPSLIFALFSPATMKVHFGSEEFEEDEGLLFIENAQSGNYELRVKGKYPGGKYTVLVGQVSETGDKWFEINGEINSLLPFLQTDIYTINFAPSDLQDFPVNQDNISSLFDLLIQRFNFIQESYGADLNNAIAKTKQAKSEFLKDNFRSSLTHILEINNEIFKARINTVIPVKNMLFDSLTQLENIYVKMSVLSGNSPKKNDLTKKLISLKKQYLEFEIYLLNQKNKNINIQEKIISLTQMSEKLQKAEDELSENNLTLTEIILLSAEKLGKEIK